MENKTSNKMVDSNIHTYRRIRSAIGYLGIALPIVLILLSQVKFTDTELRTSISHFYYTNLRDYFTGTLCAVGIFMIRYKGVGNPLWYKNDNLLTNIAGFMAFLVAFLPTSPEAGDYTSHTMIMSIDPDLTGNIHYAAAAILFLSFSMLSIWVFTIGQQSQEDIPVSYLNENYIYRTCGYIILGCIAIMFILHLSDTKIKYSTLILEAIALFAFGVSWLIKGRGLGDTGKRGEMIYRERNLKKQNSSEK